MSGAPAGKQASSVDALLAASGRIRKAFASVDFAEVLLERLVHAQTGTHAAKKRFAEAVSVCDKACQRVQGLLRRLSTLEQDVSSRLSDHLHATMLRQADEALRWVEIALGKGIQSSTGSYDRVTLDVFEQLEILEALYPPTTELVVQAMVRLSEIIDREVLHLGHEAEQAQRDLIEFNSAFRRGRQQLREVKSHSRAGRRSFDEVADAVSRANYVTEVARMCADSEFAQARNTEERHFAENLKNDVEELTQRSIRLTEQLSELEAAMPKVEGQFDQVMVTWRRLLDSHKGLASREQVEVALSEARSQLRGLPASVIADTESRFAKRLEDARRRFATRRE